MQKIPAMSRLSAAGLIGCFISAGCVVPAEATSSEEADTSQLESALVDEVQRVVGDAPCSPGYGLASAQEAQANRSAICNQLGTWDIARLAGGGSIDGPGYGCNIRDLDSRGLGHSVCKQNHFVKVSGDGTCPSGYTIVSPLLASANQNLSCSVLGTWDIARLAGGGSMEGPGYGCVIRDLDSRGLGHTLCAQTSFIKVLDDRPCANGWTLLAPQDARARQSEVCAKLGPWDIARLAGGGTMEGPSYGCTIRDRDTRSTGHALCKALY
jgi:hypothetical protein